MTYNVTAKNIDWDVEEQDINDSLSENGEFYGVFVDGECVYGATSDKKADEWCNAALTTSMYGEKDVYVDRCSADDIDESDWDELVNAEIVKVKKSLPKTLTVEVEADNKDEAIDAAVDQMSEDIGWLINGAERYKVTKKKGKK